MEISKIFKNALTFPISDYQKLLIVGVICILSSITTIYSSFAGNNELISMILGIVSLVFGLILGGYYISVIKETIDGSDKIPNFDWIENFVMGIKYVVLEIIYMIIPAIILVIVGYATGLFDSIITIVENIDFDILSTATNQTSVAQAFSAIPQSAADTFITSLTITAIVAIILIIIFEILCIVGTCRLANTGKLGQGLNIKKVFDDISAIGWGKFIIWLIINAIIIVILAIISWAVGMIPYVGGIIATLIVSPFIVLYMGKSLGLIYAGKDQ